MNDHADADAANQPQAGQLHVHQAARMLGLDAFTFYALLQRDRIPYTFVDGGEIMVSEQDVNRLMSKN